MVTGGLGVSASIASGGTITTENASAATSGSTGALRCSGGCGIAGNIWVGSSAQIGTNAAIGGTLTWTTTGRSVYSYVGEQNLTGTNVLWANIPSTHRDVVINFRDLSASGAANPLIQIGNNNGFAATGYEGNFFRDGFSRSETVGAPLWNQTISGLTTYMHGSITIRLMRNYTVGLNFLYDYFIFGSIYANVAGTIRSGVTSAFITLSGINVNDGVLDRVKLLLSANSFNVGGVASLAYC